MTKILLVPGLDGSTGPHWQAWWAATDPQALLLDWRAPSRPDPDAWEAELAGAVLHHPGALLVGHSLGAVAIARLLGHWPGLDVAGALLVAPADPARSARTCGFGGLPDRPLDCPATVVMSRNDPWLDPPGAERMAAALGAGLVDLGAAGHVNVASGFGPWARGRQLARSLLARIRRPGAAVPAGARTGGPAGHRAGDRRLPPGRGVTGPAAPPPAPAGALPPSPGAEPSRAAVWGRCYP